MSLTAAAAPWYEHYALAEKAIADEKWNEAVTQLNEAIQRRGDSGAHVRSYGMKVVSYFPYLRLGIAYHKLGQYEAAIQAFETEERLGAIRDSPADLDALKAYRRAALDAQSSEATRIESDRRTIAAQAIRNARELERSGRIDDALAEASRALAVLPDDPAAKQLVTQLQTETATRQRRARDREELETLVRDGRTALAAGNYDSAVSLLGQASRILDENPGFDGPADLPGLVARAQKGLSDELAKEAASDRVTMVASILEDVRRLERAGETADALARLQRALALDPSNRDARTLETGLLGQREKASNQTTISQLSQEMASAFAEGRYEASLAAANRVLALDAANPAALEQVRQSYVALGRRLLGGTATGNVPPAIRFADFRTTEADGTRIQLVSAPEFRLSGIAIDKSEARLSFLDQNDRPLQGTSSSQLVGDYHITEFVVSLSLVPGTTTIRAAAADPDGLTSNSEYVVRYVPPLTGRLWFKAVLAVVAIVAIALPIALRRVRRNLLRTRRFNPYIAGAPVLSDELFFGREKLVQRILQTIHNNSLLLHGERRIGKTSLQHHLRKRLLELEDPGYQFHPVLIDLQGVPEERFFATLMEEIDEQLKRSIGNAELRIRENPEAEYGYREFVSDLRVVLGKLRSATTKQVKLVLLIDEVDELNDYDPRVNQRLRSLFMKSFAENLVAIVSGVQIKKDWAREASPWYNFFEEIEVTPLGREDVEALVTTPIAGVLRVEDGLVERILEVTGGKPYLVQRLCISLVNHVYDQGRLVITPGDIDAVGAPETS